MESCPYQPEAPPHAGLSKSIRSVTILANMYFRRHARNVLFMLSLVVLGAPSCAWCCPYPTSSAAGAPQDEIPVPPIGETPATPSAPDPVIDQIRAELHAVTTPDLRALAQALHANEHTADAPAITPLRNLEGNGTPDLLLRWAAPVTAAAVSAAPDSRPLWLVYFLSWDGSRWNVSRLLAGVDECTPAVINLGPPVGRALALVAQEGEPVNSYPVIYQVKEHAASLLWDGESDDSLYKALLAGTVNFRQPAHAAAQMVVTGRADPGLLQVEPHGNRGFKVQMTYDWNGKAFKPARTEYVPNQDYTIYRFISALHLHDYRSAYAAVDPAKFLRSDAPSLDAFRRFIQDNFPEFLRDEVFEAPSEAAGSPDRHAFVLSTPSGRNVYHPEFIDNGKFLMSGLTRTHE